MASVRDIDSPLPQTASNTALFEMMMHYKQVADDASAKLLKARFELEEVKVINTEYVEANARGAILVTQKLEAGVMLLACVDRLGQLCGDMRRSGVNIEEYAPEIEHVLLRADIGAHMLYDVPMGDLQAHEELDQEVIDLTGEETETDSEMEEVEL